MIVAERMMFEPKRNDSVLSDLFRKNLFVSFLPVESAFARTYEIGKWALERGYTVIEIVRQFEHALATVPLDLSREENLNEKTERATALLGETLGSLKNTSKEFTNVLSLLCRHLSESVVLRRRLEHERVRRTMAEEETALSRKSMDYLPQAICLCDLNGRISYLNRSAERLYHCAAGELCGRDLRVILQPVDVADISDTLRTVRTHGVWSGLLQATHGGKLLRSEWRLLSKDHSDSSVLIVCDSLRDFPVVHEWGDRLFDARATNIAHELNEVLAPIVLAIEALHNESSGKETRVVLDMLIERLQLCVKLTSEILCISRDARGAGKGQWASSMIRSLEWELRKARCDFGELKLRSPDLLWPLRMNTTEAYQLLLQLCLLKARTLPVNSSMMMTALNVEIERSVACRIGLRRAGAYVMVVISSASDAIVPSSLLTHLGPINVNADRELEKLSCLIVSLDGFLGTTTTGKNEAEFVLCLPAEQWGQMVVHSKSHVETSGKTILVIDEDKEMQELCRNVLQRSGYNVLSAHNGAEALTLYAEHSANIAALLVDLLMHTVDNIRLFQKVLEINPHAKIILASAHWNKDALPKSENLEIAFLPKPYTPENLLRIVDNIITPSDRRNTLAGV
ncbi:MAG TPA: response regulator [Bacteroidota bacterium]|nr:response regulator [Bacteroidota bacterium]